MRASFVIFLAFAHIMFLVGCGKSEKTDETHSSQVGGNQVSSNTGDMVHAPEVACTGSVARTLAELDVEFASISNYVYRQNAELDGRVRKTIEDAIAAIEEIEDFENTAQNNPKVKAAMDQVSAIEEVLDTEVLPLLSK